MALRRKGHKVQLSDGSSAKYPGKQARRAMGQDTLSDFDGVVIEALKMIQSQTIGLAFAGEAMIDLF